MMNTNTTPLPRSPFILKVISRWLTFAGITMDKVRKKRICISLNVIVLLETHMFSTLVIFEFCSPGLLLKHQHRSNSTRQHRSDGFSIGSQTRYLAAQQRLDSTCRYNHIISIWREVSLLVYRRFVGGCLSLGLEKETSSSTILQ